LCGFFFPSSCLLYLLIIFQDCWASQHHGRRVNIWNWTPPTGGSWRSQWWCYENWSPPFLSLLKVSLHTCAGAVEGLWTQVPPVWKVSCRYCSKHWKITFPCFDFLARFLGFGFSLFPPH
jgi:hypothetical protein